MLLNFYLDQTLSNSRLVIKIFKKSESVKFGIFRLFTKNMTNDCTGYHCTNCVPVCVLLDFKFIKKNFITNEKHFFEKNYIETFSQPAYEIS